MQIIRLTEQDLRNIIQDSVNRLYESYYGTNVEWDKVNAIVFTVSSTYDQDELDDELADQEFESEEEKQEYINDYQDFNTFFRCEFYDTDQEQIGLIEEHPSELEDDLPKDLYQRIIKKYQESPQYDTRYEVYDILYEKYKDYEPEEAAKHFFYTTDEYSKGMHGYILQDGTIIMMSPGSDHNEITCVNGIESKWDFVMRGNVSIYENNVRIGQELSYSQERILRKLVASYDEVYVDLFDENGNEHTGCFYNASPSYFCNVFDRYYRDGILPNELMR